MVLLAFFYVRGKSELQRYIVQVKNLRPFMVMESATENKPPIYW